MKLILSLCFCLPGLTFCFADDKPPFKLNPGEQKILEMTNKERAAHDLPPLKVSETLTKVARAHSANMAKQGKMEHVLDGKNPGERLEDGGYNWGAFRENIAAGYNWSIDKVMKGWMDSETHRRNILAKDVDEIGIGIAAGPKDMNYYTVDFGKLRK